MSENLDRLSGDDRSVSAVLGFILIFGILVVSLAVYQAVVVPEQNSTAEFEHYQDARDDMNQLRSAHINTVESGQQRSVSLATGTLYPSRVIAVNPPPVEGTLRSETVGEIHVSAGGEQLNLTQVCGAVPETNVVRYTPDYSELSEREAPQMIYDNTVLYLSPAGESSPTVDTDQLIFDGNTINLLPLQADIDESGLTGSVEFTSRSYGPTESIGEGGTVQVTLPTPEPELWRDELLEDIDTVEQVTTNTDEVTVTLEDNEWNLQCAITRDSDQTPVVPAGDDSDTEPLDGERLDVGQGGVSEFGSGDGARTFAAANGRWKNISNITGIDLSNVEPARLTRDQGFEFEGYVVQLAAEIRDGASDNRVFVDVQLEQDADGEGFGTRQVVLADGDGVSQELSLTSDAASSFYAGGQVDILNEENYDDEFGELVEQLQDMENATWQTSEVVGRVDVEITH